MLTFIRNTPIFRRLFIAFAIVTIIPAIVIALLGSGNLTSLQTKGQAVRTSFDAQNLAAQEQTNLQAMNALLQTRHNQVMASLSGQVKDPSLYAAGALIGTNIVSRETDFNQALATYQSDFELASSSNMGLIRSILESDAPNSGIISDQQAALNDVSKEWPVYQIEQDTVLNQLNNLDTLFQTNLKNGIVLTPSQVTQYYQLVYKNLFIANQSFTGLGISWQRVVDDAVSMGKTVTAVGVSETQPITLYTALAVVFVILVVLFTGYILNLTITQPLRDLAALTRRIARGDTNARTNIPGRDEIHLVASSMNSMLDNIVRLIQDAQAQRDNLQAQVEKLVSEVSGVGEGDLSVQAEVTGDALGVLADSFNYMVEELGSLIVRVKMVAQEVEGSTVAILDHMTHLVETDDVQLNQITHATTSVEHMADSSRQVAERARILYGVSHDTLQNAQGGRNAVQQAVEGMGHIHENVQATASKVQTLGERSREINNIVEVISSIAHQTNRLALDAAIQAAMAGENGKGFAAVAADIRRLAERAKDQASMIAKIVRSVREDIGAAAVSMQDTERETSTGAKLTEEAGSALLSIFTSVEQQSKEIENINQVATQQLQTSSAIVNIMREISHLTQQSSMDTRDASFNMQRLARLVEQLRASTEAFKLQESQGSYTPSANGTFISEQMQDNQFTVSSIFRAVTASPVSSGAANSQQMLPAASHSNSGSSPYYPMAPNQQQNGWNAAARQNQQNGWNAAAQQNQQNSWNAAAQQNQQNGWNAAAQQNLQDQQWNGEPYNQELSNGSRNR